MEGQTYHCFSTPLPKIILNRYFICNNTKQIYYDLSEIVGRTGMGGELDSEDSLVMSKRWKLIMVVDTDCIFNVIPILFGGDSYI